MQRMMKGNKISSLNLIIITKMLIIMYNDDEADGENKVFVFFLNINRKKDLQKQRTHFVILRCAFHKINDSLYQTEY
jgi:hypothetical protein